MGGSAVTVGHRVVDVADCGGPVTARSPARQVTGAHELGQRPRWLVAGFGRQSERGLQRLHLGRLRQFANDFGGHGAFAVYPTGILAGACQRRLIGNHMHQHSAALTTTRGHRAVWAIAAAAQPVGPRRQRPQGVGASLRRGSRIVRAHGVGQFVQPAIQRVTGAGQHDTVYPAEAGLGRDDVNVPFGQVFAGSAHRVPVDLRDDAVHFGGKLAPGHRRPAAGPDRQPFIHGGEGFGVSDQLGAVHDDAEQPEVDVSGEKTSATRGSRSRMARA